MVLNWYSYDPEDGFELHATEAEARARVDAVLEEERERAGSDGWRDECEMMELSYGRVVAAAMIVWRGPPDPDSDFEDGVEYAIREVGNTPTGLGLGSDGLRDPEFPCEDFARGFPADIAPQPHCDGDGHYLCGSCQYWNGSKGSEP